MSDAEDELDRFNRMAEAHNRSFCLAQDEARNRLRLIRHILSVPAHKLDDTAFLRACVVNAREQVQCALDGKVLAEGEHAFMSAFVLPDKRI